MVHAGCGNHHYTNATIASGTSEKDNTILRNGANGFSVAMGDGYM